MPAKECEKIFSVIFFYIYNFIFLLNLTNLYPNYQYFCFLSYFVKNLMSNFHHKLYKVVIRKIP